MTYALGSFVFLLLHELRLVKSSTELKVMRAAAAITAAAHDRVLRTCRPGLSEARLEAELLYGFALGGARHPAYVEEHGVKAMQKPEFTVRAVLNRGKAAATLWTCDLSVDYVKINAEYRT